MGRTAIVEDGYVLHSGRPYSLWFCFLGYPTGLLNDFVVRRGRDSHRLLRQAEEWFPSPFGFPSFNPEVVLIKVVIEMLMTARALVGPHQPSLEKPDESVDRSEERRVGKECRSRG